MYVPRELDEPVFDVEQSPASQHHNDVDSATTAKTSGSLGRWPRTDYSVYATMSRFVSTSDRPRTSRGQLDYGVVKRAASMPSSRASRISDQVEREATRGSVIKEASESDDDDDDDDDSKSDYVHFNPADPLFLPPRAAPILRLDCSNTAQSSGIERVSRPRLRSAAVLSDEQFQVSHVGRFLSQYVERVQQLTGPRFWAIVLDQLAVDTLRLKWCISFCELL